MTAKLRKQQIEEMLADDPNDPFLHYTLALEYMSEGADEEAARRLCELSALAPDYIPAYLQAGQALIRLGRKEDAATAFRAGIVAARKQGDQHAAEKMQGFLEALG